MSQLVSIWQLMITSTEVVMGLNVLAMVVFYRRLPATFKSLLFFMLVALLTDVGANLISLQKINNMPLLHVYTVLELISLSFFYKMVFKDWQNFHRYFWKVLPVIVLLLVVNSILWESIFGFNSNAKSCVQLIMIGFSVAYFFRNFGTTDFTNPQNLAMALVNSAILVYYSGSLFVFMFSKMLNTPNTTTSSVNQAVFWMLNALLFLLFQILTILALWKTIRTRER